MTKILQLWLLLFLFSTLPSMSDEIRFNQIGYLPKANKVALVINSEETSFQILKGSQCVYQGTLSPAKNWTDSGESVKLADFSKLTRSDSYSLQVGNTKSEIFKISSNVYKDVSKASIKALYYLRCSEELKEQHAGKWARPLGHPDTECQYHPSSGKKTGTLSSPGGWYDAGDFGKYVVPGAYAVYRLLSLYEKYPRIIKDGSLNIPQSRNGISDLLDEIKVELDWLKTMQDDDGGVFFKLTTARFEGIILPHQAKKKRLLIGKSTASTLDFAAVMAMASRLMKPYGRTYTKDCLERALSAYQWAEDNPRVLFKNPSDISTGEYGDNNMRDNFFLAATELLVATGEKKYLQVINQNKLIFNQYSQSGWSSLNSNALITLTRHKNVLSKVQHMQLKQSLFKRADQICAQINSSPARLPDISYRWGSNGDVAFQGVFLVFAFEQSQDKTYIKAAAEIADYLMGKNGVGYCFMTGFGSKPVKNIHHRQSNADKVNDPVPGLLSGGPNSGKQDRKKVQYQSSYPAKSFVDDQSSYASNEITIYWNAEV
ncbi:MAG: glycoside hydrolase family 9 protein, partial [Planctomycetes bacterium]|nr:glycoside hydrolase family 9 protein [Planctomycetota bacterium]